MFNINLSARLSSLVETAEESIILYHGFIVVLYADFESAEGYFLSINLHWTLFLAKQKVLLIF